MRLIVILLLSASIATGQNIGTKVLTPGTSDARLNLSPRSRRPCFSLARSPGPLARDWSVASNPKQGLVVQIEHPEGSHVLVLRALNENVRMC